jgi:hypothetical protein
MNGAISKHSLEMQLPRVAAAPLMRAQRMGVQFIGATEYVNVLQKTISSAAMK